MLLGAVATGCTDTWDEHYAEQTYGSGTLMQAIEQDPDLTNFAEVLKATGYDATLGNSQVFTVFAPTNQYFTEADKDAVIEQYNDELAKGRKNEKNLAIKEFLQNHIALYNYSVSAAASDSAVTMMNGKKVAFTSTGFGNSSYARSNVQTGNGVLFSINGRAQYDPNIFEYLEKDADLDSVKNFIYKYNIEKFMAALSVPGEIIDGNVHYLDSVTWTQNDLLEDYDQLYAEINNEDSSYVFLAPTNAEWDRLLERNKQYFVYDAQISEKDSFEYIYPRLNILRGAFFSANENRGILAQNAALDSIIATTAIPYFMRQYYYGSYDKRVYTYMKPFDADGIFANSTNIPLSNGNIKKTDDWKIGLDQTFLYDIVMEGESRNTLDSLNIRSSTNTQGNTMPAKYGNVSSDNKFYNKVSGNGYLEISPSSTSNVTNALLDIRNVYSNIPYDVYIVFAPAEAGDTLASEAERKPTLVRVSLQCNGPDGNPYYMLNTGEFSTKYPVYKNPANKSNPNTPNTTYCCTGSIGPSDGVSVDSVYVGTFTFPTCSYNTEAQVKMLIDGRVSTTQVNAGTHTKTIRIDCIVFKPVLNKPTEQE